MKFFNKWLTLEEEEKLKIPSRRTFFIGALSTLSLAAAPEGFKRLGNLYVPDDRVWHPAMRINWVGMPEGMPNSLYATLIDDIKRHAEHMCALGPEHFRYHWEPDKFDRCHPGELHILTIETDIPDPPRQHSILKVYNTSDESRRVQACSALSG